MASEEQRVYRAKLASLGFQAKPKPTKTTVLYDDDRGGGRIAGTETEFKDGHVDATITPPHVHMQGKADR